MSNKKSGSRTLLLSVLMSSPGPIVMGFALMSGRSSTQIADFIRRSSELLGIIMSYVVFRMTSGDTFSEERREHWERRSNAFVGVMMCLGGSLMALLSLMGGAEDKGNVIPALAIAVLGVIANTLFWRKYTRLNKAEPNAILQVQARLYRAKSLVDGCVTAALLAVVIAPASKVTAWLDLIGSVIVALYLVWCGSRTIWENTNHPCKTGYCCK
ncbi:MAG: cation transporter [Oscillospiraceae bacterium]|nr:cation transporter [Oscillospiraceae bacterium]